MTIDQRRQRQPLRELRRKARKARRKGWWTQEDVDLFERRTQLIRRWLRRINWT